MRWDDSRQSENVEDRRGAGGGFGGGGFRLPIGRGGLGLGGMVVLGLLAYAFGIDPLLLLQGVDPTQQEERWQPAERAAAPADEHGRFVSAVLGQTEDVWRQILPEQTGVRYEEPRLVLFTGATRSACGAAQSAMGPFYCPVDRKVYLDLAFFEAMRTRLGGGGEFAEAYVIAHEVGHHVENLLGILGRVHDQRQRVGEAEGNALSVRVELMADCLAGVWAAHADRKWQILEQGDVERAVATAEAIGDDRLQRRNQGYTVPDSFTHGTSQQRVRALMTGMKSGRVEACNTFKAR
jgi:uncharacterized protein